MDLEKLQEIANEIRGRIISNSHKTKMPHLGSCLSCVDILVAVYFHSLKIDPAKPDDPGRDRFILSKGHGAPALFQVLAKKGFYPEVMLDSYGEDGGIFAEHPPTPDHLAGIEAATGSLGHGLPIGLGMALSARIQKKSYDVVALLSDGECNEGSIWEAAMMAAAGACPLAGCWRAIKVPPARVARSISKRGGLFMGGMVSGLLRFAKPKRRGWRSPCKKEHCQGQCEVISCRP